MLRRVLCRSQSTAQDSKPILYLKGELGESPVQLADTFRVVNGDEADGITFPGMAGKIDYVLAGQGQVRAGKVVIAVTTLLTVGGAGRLDRPGLGGPGPRLRPLARHRRHGALGRAECLCLKNKMKSDVK